MGWLLTYNDVQRRTMTYKDVRQKIIVIFKFRALPMFDMSILLVDMYVDNISHFGLPVWFWQTKRIVVLRKALRFFTIRKTDQGNCIKFCVKMKLKNANTLEMLTVGLGDSSMSRTQVQLWYNRFKECREDVYDYARRGRPIT